MGPSRRMDRRLARLRRGAENALEIVRLGRLSPRQGSPYEVVHQGKHYRLRHYGRSVEAAPALLLVPPLMLTAEIYDVAPDISAVATLVKGGVDPWVVDFGAPEHEEGGMGRTLDDHVRSVADAVARVREITGRDVHLAGYSQGGMFVYQAAAWRKSEGLASLITFGSPVDIHRNIPRVSTDLTARLIRSLRPLVEPPLRRLEGLPGVLTSTGFKLFSFRKELEQVADLLGKLHDRRALEKRENRRRFLGGEGFVAWPGPALMKFIDEFIVHNRMVSGGFVIDGQTVTLADIHCPILYFVGGRDDIARPPTVRAIAEAATASETHEIVLHAGHFGLVVGSLAMKESWPTVVEWLHWQEGAGPRPRLLRVKGERPAEPVEIEEAAFAEGLDFELFYDAALRTAESAWKRLGDAAEDAGDAFDQLRHQLPRLLRLRAIEDTTRVSMARTLSERARSAARDCFFIYRDRSVTYADTERRVNNVVRGFASCGAQEGHHVGVLMRPRPSALTVVTALNRLGAVAVLVSPQADEAALRTTLAVDELDYLVADPENAARALKIFPGRVLVLGGGGPNRPLPEGVTDMEAIDPDAVKLPRWYRPNGGQAQDLALVIATGGRDRDRAALVTNRRWAFSALGAAAACTLTRRDTVYCCLPLHHPSGLLVSAGSALAAGARLALATRFDPSTFWTEVRRYGATVVFYAGEMGRCLVDAPVQPGERNSPLRLFAGSGMRADVWRRIVERFGVGVLEFYAATEVNVVLTNAAGKKVGALGRPLPGSAAVALAAYDFAREDLVRDGRGRIVEARAGEPGVLLARLPPRHPLLATDGLSDGPEPRSRGRILRSAFEEGDHWFVTGDWIRRDADGDYWFVDRLEDVVRGAGGPIATRAVEDALYGLGEVALCAVYGVRQPGTDAEVPVAAVVFRPGKTLEAEGLAARLREAGTDVVLPAFVRVVEAIPMTDGYRPIKGPLRAAGIPEDGEVLVYDVEGDGYVRRARAAVPGRSV